MTAKNENKTVELYDPNIEDRTRTVPAADVERWVKAGWSKTAPDSK